MSRNINILKHEYWKNMHKAGSLRNGRFPASQTCDSKLKDKQDEIQLSEMLDESYEEIKDETPNSEF